MKRASMLAMLLLILAVGALPAVAITNGEPDGDGHPNVGLMIAEIDGEPEWRCTGTLIAPRVFLTAGHCVGDGATAARVWFDTDLTDTADYPYGGDTAYEGTPVPHPDYSWGDSDPHDVGLVILDKSVTGIPLANLPALPNPDDPDDLAFLDQLKKDGDLTGGYGNNHNKEDGVFFRSVGYGGTLEDWAPPDLAYDRIRRVADSEYVALTQIHLHLSQKAVFDESGSCFGDSGGPVFWVGPEDPEDPQANEIIVAVTSSGDGQCVATGFNYRVDTAEILGWIYEEMGRVE